MVARGSLVLGAGAAAGIVASVVLRRWVALPALRKIYANMKPAACPVS